MLETELFTLAHPAVQAAKRRFEANRKRRNAKPLSFDDLFEYFKADCVRQNAVGKEVGLTRERIRKIYDKYFREFFGDKSGMQRVRACTIESHLVKIKQAETELFTTNAVVKTIVEKARAAGCRVEAIPLASVGIYSGPVHTRRLLINGHRCSLHYPTSCFKTAGGRRYMRVAIMNDLLLEEDALIIHTAIAGYPPRTFVLPNVALRNVYAVFRGCVNLTLPLENLPVYRNNTPLVDYWQYEDAWHLLSPKQDSPAP